MNLCRCLCLTLAVVALSAAAETRITFHGGAGEVGGSSALVERDGVRLLVDCGSVFDADGASRGTDAAFGFDPKKIDAVVLTHAHQDHAGRIPELFNAGFSGTVYATEPTVEILYTMYKSQVQYDTTTRRTWRWSKKSKRGGTVHWRPDCTWNTQIARANLQTFTGTFNELSAHLEKREDAHAGRISCCRTCAGLELDGMMARMHVVAFGERKKIGGLSFELQPVRHLPGAASIRIEDGAKSFLFSGDMGTFRSRLGGRPVPARKADWVFVESTYGKGRDADEKVTESEYARFCGTVGETLRAGGLAWIPAFALDRSQRVLLEIARGMREGTIPTNAPIYLTSPTAREVTAKYAAHPEWFAPNAVEGLEPLLKRIRPRFNPAKDLRKGGILVTTSGMLDTAASYVLIPDLLPQAKVTVCLVGYQAPDTPGHALMTGAKEITFAQSGEKETIPVRARVAKKFNCFSGHGDAAEIDAWLVNNRDSRIFLIHGDSQGLKERRDDLAEHHAGSVEIVEKGKTYSTASEPKNIAMP